MADQLIEHLHPSGGKLNLLTGKRFTIRVKPGLRGFRAELEDLLFHFDSAVMLPEGPRGLVGASDPDRTKVTGLEALAAAMSHAVLHPDRKIVLTGHADTSGADAGNLVLSGLRAKNVFAVLTGGRKEWVDTADARHKVEDYQAILKWAARQRGWPTDPGEVDGKDGPATREALENLQRNYNLEFKKEIDVDGKIGPETWGAVFDLYQEDLARLLVADAAKMDSIRSGLVFVDAGRKHVGCGENFPIELKDRDNFKSQANRRVEILFFDPGQEPLLPCHASPDACDPDKCDLYGKNRYVFEPIPESVVNGPVTIQLKYEDGEPMALAEFEAQFGEDIVEGVTDGEGKAVIDPPPGTGGTFRLTLKSFPEEYA
jgi:outer membrane protein OmpA-like peptidoglycan-associated protein